LEKFELISNKIVNLLARPPAAASLLQRGAPTRRASVIFFARDFLALRASKVKIYSVLAPPTRARTRKLPISYQKLLAKFHHFGHEKIVVNFDIL
jgi:hypothetical protein